MIPGFIEGLENYLLVIRPFVHTLSLSVWRWWCGRCNSIHVFEIELLEAVPQ
jgi:hypothetical protein